MRAKGILQEQQRPHTNGKQIPHIEVQKQITRIKMPRLCTEDVWALIASAEDIVQNELQRDDNKAMVEESIHTTLESLLLSVRRRTLGIMSYQGDQRSNDAVKKSSERVVPLTGENANHDFLEDERSYQDA